MRSRLRELDACCSDRQPLARSTASKRSGSQADGAHMAAHRISDRRNRHVAKCLDEFRRKSAHAGQDAITRGPGRRRAWNAHAYSRLRWLEIVRVPVHRRGRVQRVTVATESATSVHRARAALNRPAASPRITQGSSRRCHETCIAALLLTAAVASAPALPPTRRSCFIRPTTTRSTSSSPTGSRRRRASPSTSSPPDRACSFVASPRRRRIRKAMSSGVSVLPC